MSRTWIKVYCDRWLEGTLAQESLDVRGAWITLLSLVGAGKYSDDGELKMTAIMGFTDQSVARSMAIPCKKWKRIKAILVQTERIIVDNPTNIIKVTNWKEYQTEYQRQKPYREQKKERGTGSGKYKVCPICNQHPCICTEER